MHAEDWQVHPGALGPGTEVGSWRVVERLGVGGFGAVYRVEDVARPGDFYALKLALRQGDERAEREVHLLMSKGVHPNVVRLHACGRWPHPQTGFLYFVMDWVPGLALHTWVETVNPTFRQLAEKAGKVALALGALHDKGVLHRDFKPEHVLIREKDGEPILLDFGVGRYAGADTLTTAVLPPATPHLLSPEAVTFFRTHSSRPGARYEARPTDDLYALGVSLYRLVTGHWPFPPELPPDLLYMQIEAVAPGSPAAFNRRVPRALSDGIMRLLSKKPGARFQSGHDVHAALVAAVALGGPEGWERTVFEWEDAGGRPCIRQPEGPTRERTPPPRKLVLGPLLPPPRRPSRRLRAGPGRGQAVHRTRARGWLFAGALAAALVCSVWAVKPPAREALPSSTAVSHASPAVVVRPPSHEVAREVEPFETPSAAALALTPSTPAAVAVPVTLAEDETPVTKKKTAISPSTTVARDRASGFGSVGKALCVGAASAALACGGPPVRPSPPAPPAPESCPPGAVEAMQKLGLHIFGKHPVTFSEEPEVITVREGAASNHLIAPWGTLPGWTRIQGKLFFGSTRVYGRFTEAHTPDGDRYPVCMELWDSGGGRGLKREDGNGSDSVQVFSGGYLKAVKQFE